MTLVRLIALALAAGFARRALRRALASHEDGYRVASVALTFSATDHARSHGGRTLSIGPRLTVSLERWITRQKRRRGITHV
jgi:hypothetical protein